VLGAATLEAEMSELMEFAGLCLVCLALVTVAMLFLMAIGR